MNNIAPNYISQRFNRPTHTYKTRQSNNVQQSHFSTVTHGRNSFTNFGAHLWNNLPNNIRKAENFKQFKTLIYNWAGPDCKCSCCRVAAL